jgi:hypothetical protein
VKETAVPKSRHRRRGLVELIIGLIHFHISSSGGDPSSVLLTSMSVHSFKGRAPRRPPAPRRASWIIHELKRLKRKSLGERETRRGCQAAADGMPHTPSDKNGGATKTVAPTSIGIERRRRSKEQGGAMKFHG